MTIAQHQTLHADFVPPIQNSTIAQFVFDHDPALNLALLVKELDGALQRSGAGKRMITWDCDDLVLLDVEGARFTLSYCRDGVEPGKPASLMISVGPGPGGFADPIDRRRHDELCHLIAERLKARFAPERMLWHQVTGPVTADLIDDLFDRLPDFEITTKPASAPVRSETTKVLRAFPETDDLTAVSFAEKAQALKAAKTERARAAALASKPAPTMQPANTEPVSLRPANPEMARLRAALYPQPADGQAPQTVKLRLAASTMDMTLMVVFLPAGAAMLTYSLLKGGNVNASARVMALTCSILGLSQLPFAHSLMGLMV